MQSGSRAYTVSYDRPYAVQGCVDGAGNFFVWDYPMVRWMEKQGYDVTYVTSPTSRTRASSARSPAIACSSTPATTSTTRTACAQASLNAINAGTNMALFSANNFYFRVESGANPGGPADAPDAHRQGRADRAARP